MKRRNFLTLTWEKPTAEEKRQFLENGGRVPPYHPRFKKYRAETRRETARGASPLPRGA